MNQRDLESGAPMQDDTIVRIDSMSKPVTAVAEGLRFENDFEVSLWANNLTDEYYNMVIFDTPAVAGTFNGYPGTPRMFGVEAGKRF